MILQVEVLETITISFCVYGLLRFYTYTKDVLRVRRAFVKFVCFKIIVAIRFTQAWVFSLALSYGGKYDLVQKVDFETCTECRYQVVDTSSSFTYNDIIWGIPSLLTCIEMVIFSVLFWYAYSSSEYSQASKPKLERMSVGKAVGDVLNPSDLLHGFANMVDVFLHLRATQGWRNWIMAKKTTGWVGKCLRLTQRARKRQVLVKPEEEAPTAIAGNLEILQPNADKGRDQWELGSLKAEQSWLHLSCELDAPTRARSRDASRSCSPSGGRSMNGTAPRDMV